MGAISHSFMRHKFPKAEHLCLQRDIDQLFTAGARFGRILSTPRHRAHTSLRGKRTTSAGAHLCS